MGMVQMNGLTRVVDCGEGGEGETKLRRKAEERGRGGGTVLDSWTLGNGDEHFYHPALEPRK